jgi:hypothetical protein
MLQPETYKEWTAASWPGSFYQGEWKEGKDIKFISEDGSGTKAHIAEVKPFKFIAAEHIALLQKGGIEDTTSEQAKNWVGITENYNYKETNGNTELTVEINTRPEWEKMFNDGFPNALQKLKEICER